MFKNEYCYAYPRPMVTVDVLIFSIDFSQILLIKRKHNPFEGKWAIPGGFIDMDETAEFAAKRELQEETGLENIEVQQFYTFSDVDRDPRGRTITIAYWAAVEKEFATIQAGDDAAEAKWWPVNALPKLAFDHELVLQTALEKIAN